MAAIGILQSGSKEQWTSLLKPDAQLMAFCVPRSRYPWPFMAWHCKARRWDIHILLVSDHCFKKQMFATEVLVKGRSNSLERLFERMVLHSRQSFRRLLYVVGTVVVTESGFAIRSELLQEPFPSGYFALWLAPQPFESEQPTSGTLQSYGWMGGSRNSSNSAGRPPTDEQNALGLSDDH
jgi:hypothetical protein